MSLLGQPTPCLPACRRVQLMRGSCRPALQRRWPSIHTLQPPIQTIACASTSGDPDAELEKRLEKLRIAKGATPYGQSAKQAKQEGEAKKDKPSYDWTGETVYYEGGPHVGDLAVNLALGTTLVWLPLTFSSVSRAAFVKYRFTDRRFSVSTTAPWKAEQTDVAYQEVKDVVTVGRGIGLWGDMVVTLKDNSKVELRSLDRFLELKAYILQRRDELAPASGVLTASELMGEPAGGPKKKGFA